MLLCIVLLYTKVNTISTPHIMYSHLRDYRFNIKGHHHHIFLLEFLPLNLFYVFLDNVYKILMTEWYHNFFFQKKKKYTFIHTLGIVSVRTLLHRMNLVYRKYFILKKIMLVRKLYELVFHFHTNYLYINVFYVTIRWTRRFYGLFFLYTKKKCLSIYFKHSMIHFKNCRIQQIDILIQWKC